MTEHLLDRTIPQHQEVRGHTLGGLAGAWHRAMPYTRLVDCGMDPADARELLRRTESGEDWDGTAQAIGERQARRAVDAAARRRRATAIQAARHALAAFNFAQLAYDADTAEKRSGYRRYLQAVQQLVEISDGGIEPVTLPFQGGHLTGWLQRPAGGIAVGTVIVWGGLSGWGATYLPIADALLERGLACLLAEGPGQGRPRMDDGIYAGADTLEGFGRFIDFVLADPTLGGRVGIQGNSFGGLFAAHLAASDARVAACVINGAPAVPPVPEFRSAREQMFALLGTQDPVQAEAKLDALRFDPDARPILVPCLLLQGGIDPLATREYQAPFAEAMKHPASQLLVWPDGEHTLYNHAAERNALTGDWFHDQFSAAPEATPSVTPTGRLGRTPV